MKWMAKALYGGHLTFEAVLFVSILRNEIMFYFHQNRGRGMFVKQTFKQLIWNQIWKGKMTHLNGLN